MYPILVFQSPNPNDPFVQSLNSIICIEEKLDKTLMYYYVELSKIISCQTLSTYTTFGNQLDKYLEEFKNKVVQITTDKGNTIYILHEKFQTDIDKNPILPSGEILKNSKANLV